MAAVSGVNGWEDLRKQARQLENEIDLKLVSFSKLGTSHGNSNFKSESADTVPLLSGEHMFDTMALEIEQLLTKLSLLNERMGDIASSQSPTSSALVHTMQRHREILQDYNQEFGKTQANYRARREREDLLKSVRKDIDNYKTSTGLNRRMDLYLKENEHIRRSVRTSTSQFETLLDFMVDHEDFARGRMIGQLGRTKQSALWEKLKTILNSDASGPTKEVRLWVKTWNDWKCNTRKKAGELRREAGGLGSKCSAALTPMEERLLDFLGPVATSSHAAIPEGSLECTIQEADFVVSPGGSLRVTSKPTEAGSNFTMPGHPSHNTNHEEEDEDEDEEDEDEEEPPRKKLKTGSERLQAFMEVQNEHTVILECIKESMATFASAAVKMAEAHEKIANLLGDYLKK